MINWAIKKIIGTKNQRELRRMQPVVVRINELESAMRAKSDDELRAMTATFKQRLDQGAALDDLLPEAFAVAREAGRRTLNMRHFDVQLIGGMALHRGMISEMKTGEGKTLVATLPVYLNALTGRGVHVVTVNDYLATRDAEWMGQLYRFLGLTVGTVVHGLSDSERQHSYRCDVAYGQNNEFGFDYLRDNMKDSIERYVQRELHYAIVDEVDSILIDEARTPLIISGPADDAVDLYHHVNAIIPSLVKDVHYTVDEKAHSSMLTDAGVEAIERKLRVNNLYDPANIHWLHHVQQALMAHTLYKRDVNYLVDEEGQVIIVDEFTGRKMPGRRWSDGLHQAIEAKEHVTIEAENQTLATITFQNYFRMYSKLAGMTGTAETEAEEFYKIYKLDVMVIPTNRAPSREDFHDVIYKTEAGKFRHAVEEILDCQQRGQPVLVGTTSVEKSEVLAKLLRKQNIAHNVLNAKHHGREAEIIAQAGRKGSVTLSTNMAGRGTDILLGGNPVALARAVADPETAREAYDAALIKFQAQCAAEREQVLAAGGLHIIGTERHEARRIDNQLRGRAGRQGDPGSSRFYLSLEDDLLRIFGSDRISGLMERLGMNDDEPIEHRFVTRAIGNAQKKVEGHNFDIRKNLLEYDDVMNQQRKAIYALRREVLEGRFVPDASALSEAQRRAGETGGKAPTSSGKWTVESLAETMRPRVQQIVEAFFAQMTAPEAAADATDAPGVPTGATAELNEAQAQQLTHELYRFFGAVVDLRRERRDRAACLDKATQVVAESLIQQRERVMDGCDALIGEAIATHCDEKAHAEEWNLAGLEEQLAKAFNARIDLREVALEQQALAAAAWQQVEQLIEAREQELGPMYLLFFARHFLLDEIDTQWIDHLRNMDHLREGIGLRGYGQRDPKQEYKKEGYTMFAETMGRIQVNALGKLFRVQVQQDADLPRYEHKQRQVTLGRGQLEGPGGAGGAGGEAAASAPEAVEKVKPIRRSHPRLGANDPCRCGSGKKYKKCHMHEDRQQGVV
ncbi:MAG: preprotein translocase subunit SecA [Proteobacteria bacterium]|nr:preprotein translocase subunit SecA [Pseudomonadota bacterium]